MQISVKCRKLFKHVYFDTEQFSHNGQRMMGNYQGDDCLTMDSFIGLRNLNHRLTYDELFWRASLVPQKEELPFRRVSRVAFKFLTRGLFPMLPLWERFFSGQDVDKYSIYVHALPGFELKVDNASVFYKRQVVSQGNKLELMSNNFIASCSRLMELNASKNLLRSLSESIGSLTRLIRLDLHQNSSDRGICQGNMRRFIYSY